MVLAFKKSANCWQASTYHHKSEGNTGGDPNSAVESTLVILQKISVTLLLLLEEAQTFREIPGEVIPNILF